MTYKAIIKNILIPKRIVKLNLFIAIILKVPLVTIPFIGLILSMIWKIQYAKGGKGASVVLK